MSGSPGHEQTLDEALEQSRHCYESGDLKGAARVLKKAVKRFPESLNASYNLGVVFRDQERWRLAARQFGTVLQLNPREANALNNLGLVHEHLDEYPQAIACYRAAVSVAPELANAHFNLAIVLLRFGHFPEGFSEFEWRFRTDQVKPFDCPHPRWDGSPMPGTLLIHTEQGAGDAIQFLRFLPAAAARVGRILFVCPERLTRLFRQLPGIAEMRNAGTFEVSSFDAYCPLLSLPRVLGITLENLPDGGPYLQAPAESVALPCSAKAKKKLKVGITWAGSRTHLGDRHRSCELKDFDPLFEVPGVAFYSLQMDEREELNAYRHGLVDLEELQSDWADAASLVAQLDLVITVDTGIAHLAGALGKLVWIALSPSGDWRWMIDRSDSPWYRSVRLFRQSSAGDWSAVFAEIAEALQQFSDDPDS